MCKYVYHRVNCRYETYSGPPSPPPREHGRVAADAQNSFTFLFICRAVPNERDARARKEKSKNRVDHKSYRLTVGQLFRRLRVFGPVKCRPNPGKRLIEPEQTGFRFNHPVRPADDRSLFRRISQSNLSLM